MFLRQSRSFAVVAEEGSVGSAATRLHLAQPALSRQLKSLEQAVGARLLIREPRGTRLTAVGQAFLADMRVAFVQLDEALRRAQLAADGRLGVVRLALSRTASDSALFSRALKAIRDTLPDLRIVLSDLGEGQQSEKLRVGEIDIAIGVSGDPAADLATVSLFELHLDGAVLPESHPLAQHQSIAPSQLRAERLLLIGPEPSGALTGVLEQLRRAGIDAWEAYPSAESVFSLVAAGKGWSLGSMEQGGRAAVGTILRPLEGFSASQMLTARFRKNDDSPAVTHLVAFLERLMAGAEDDIPTRSASRPVRSLHSDGIQVRHLRALAAVVELGSLSHAAQKLGITLSGLSRQIQSLEREAGVALTHRTAAGITPTAAGGVLAAGATLVLSLLDDAIARTRAIGQGIGGRCVVAAVSTEFIGQIVVRAIKDLATAHPMVSIEVAEMLTPAQIEALRDRRADVAIAGANAGLVDDPQIAAVRIAEDSIECALIAEDHVLAHRASLRPSDLAETPFIFLDRAAYPKFFDVVMDNFAELGLTPRITDAFNGPRALWRAAAELGGWTLGSRSMLQRPLGGMVAIPIEGLHIPSGLQLLWRRDEVDPTVLAVLAAFRRATRGVDSGVS